MNTIERLTAFDELKFDYLRQTASAGTHQAVVRYDKDFDALILLFGPDDREFIAHYIDGSVALLYYADSYEVMGLQIEDFAHSFVPQHHNVMRIWQLRSGGETLDNFGDIIVVAQKLERRMVKEVAEAAKWQLTEPVAELVAALG